MCPLRQMPAGLPHERGGQQRIPQAEKRDGMYPLLRMHKGLPHQGTALTELSGNILPALFRLLPA